MKQRHYRIGRQISVGGEHLSVRKKLHTHKDTHPIQFGLPVLLWRQNQIKRLQESVSRERQIE